MNIGKLNRRNLYVLLFSFICVILIILGIYNSNKQKNILKENPVIVIGKIESIDSRGRSMSYDVLYSYHVKDSIVLKSRLLEISDKNYKQGDCCLVMYDSTDV
jgi:uncharacterized protein YneF (UPF0154 family)